MPSLLSRRPLLWTWLGLAFLGATLAPAPAPAAYLWYNGSYDLNDSASNLNFKPINTGTGYYFEKALVYDDFVVPVGQIWTISSVVSNNQLAYNALPTTATWEIRSGMSAGQGGTVVASGDTAATATLLNPRDNNNYIAPEYQISAAVTGVTLGAGTYWLAVAPDSAGYYADQSYIETTSGAGAIGTPKGNDGRSFMNNNLIGAGKLTFAASNLDFSMGVMGTAIAVPEPTSWLLLAAGLVGAPALLRRR